MTTRPELYILLDNLSQAAAEKDPGELIVSEQETLAASVLFEAFREPRVARAIAASDMNHSTNPTSDLGSFVNRVNGRTTNLKIRAIRHSGVKGGLSDQVNTPSIVLSDFMDFGNIADLDGNKYKEMVSAYPEYSFSRSEIPAPSDQPIMRGQYRIVARRDLNLQSLAECYGDSISLMFGKITNLINRVK